MNWDPRQLIQLSYIIETGSYQAAADSLRITQPALSRSMRMLEKQVGEPLFERIGRRAQPTDLAQKLARQGLAIRGAQDQAQQHVNAVRSGELGRIRLGAPPIISGRFLGEPIATFINRHPEVIVKLEVGLVDTLRTMLEVGQIDLAIGPMFLADSSSGLRRREILDDRVGILCRRGHPLADKKNITASDLQEYGWIMHNARSRLRAQTEATLSSLGLREVRVTVELESSEAVFSVVAGSDYLSAVPRKASHPVLPEDVTFLDLDHPLFNRPIGVIWRESSHLTGSLGQFVTHLEAHYREMERVSAARP